MYYRRILVVDADPGIPRLLRPIFKDIGYDLLTATDSARTLEIAQTELFDMIILYLGIPMLGGLEVCRQIREWSQIPIIMVSDRDDIEQRVKCLDTGADDCITKPFDVFELVARIKALLRRVGVVWTKPDQTSFTMDNLEISFINRQVLVSGVEVPLTPTEYSLLQELALNHPKVLTHSYLLHKIWGPDYGQETEYLHVFINRLRVKLEPDPANPRYIITVPAVGYAINRRALKPD